MSPLVNSFDEPNELQTLSLKYRHNFDVDVSLHHEAILPSEEHLSLPIEEADLRGFQVALNKLVMHVCNALRHHSVKRFAPHVCPVIPKHWEHLVVNVLYDTVCIANAELRCLDPHYKH